MKTLTKRSDKGMKSKKVKVTSKNQVTIPQKFYEALNIGDEVEFILGDGELIIRPVRDSGGYFSQQILNDLIDQGLQGEELKMEFARLSNAVGPAVKKMLSDVHERVTEKMQNYVDETDEIFGMEE